MVLTGLYTRSHCRITLTVVVAFALLNSSLSRGHKLPSCKVFFVLLVDHIVVELVFGCANRTNLHCVPQLLAQNLSFKKLSHLNPKSGKKSTSKKMRKRQFTSKSSPFKTQLWKANYMLRRVLSLKTNGKPWKTIMESPRLRRKMP